MKNKRVHSFSLSDESSAKLARICEKRNIKKTNLLEIFINGLDEEPIVNNNPNIDIDAVADVIIRKIKERL